MEQTELITLLVIVVAAFLCPIISSLIPRKIVPETVLLLVAGMVAGPHVLGIAQIGDAIGLLSDLGLGFLFLLAGYEIDPKDMAGRRARRGLLTWIVSFGIAVLVIVLVPSFEENELGWLAVAIALTTTAFGTLVPILKERGIADDPVGKNILAYGTWGEICPIIAIAFILSTRDRWLTAVILLAFLAVAVASAVIPVHIRERSQRFVKLMSDNAETSAQLTVRAVMILLVGLIALSAVFDLDIVLGAFAAGFALRFVIPCGDNSLEHKLNGIGYGFFIPLFFIVSGTKIDPAALAHQPLMLLLFIGMLLAVRALPIFISLGCAPADDRLPAPSRLTVALYCTTALPLIVAVTNVAVNAEAMSADTASLLVAAGGITVLLMPLLASLSLRGIDRYTAPTKKRP
ncbi:cation:proton antiporter [Adlercreutzia murintestinalis]|uniref:cation:proton antiporter n=1 Tax=Adlercreutzia murintestinalis TaxID=2941325 RepID=UPI00203F8FE0|nr:cation:proton antiporter [Adlercreutzia murintestinalis]